MLQLARIPPQSVQPASTTTARHLSLLPAATPLPAVQQLEQLEQQIRNKEENPLPAALVQPSTGKLCWFLDEAAARLLTVPFEKHSTL